MCKLETGTITKCQQQQQSATMKSRRMHLITDDGFGRHLTANLLVMTFIITVCSTNPHLHLFFLDAYHDIKEYMMQTASEMAWWSVLGLLSSSCCAIQILLNALSFGCAGFNNVLGPIRPTFVAMTIMAQMSSWYVSYSRPYQWRMTAASTLLSLFLTLLPEALVWQTAKREGSRQQLQTNGEWKDSLLNDNTNAAGIIHLQFRLTTMGCSSCVSTVSKVLDGINGVLQYFVSLEDGSAEIVLDEALVRRRTEMSTSKGSMHDLLWNDIADQLKAAGFPPLDTCNSKKER
mmetsp:Transcript_28889/g.53346  ORF Transcript_28889/g.53346 Transcript_28889/m.53346 type:complete len:290 (-) Transcript_28889:180-1049(-)